MKVVILDIVTALGFLRKTEPKRYMCMNIYTGLYMYIYIYIYVYTHTHTHKYRERELKVLARMFVEAGKSKFSEQAERPETQRKG